MNTELLNQMTAWLTIERLDDHMGDNEGDCNPDNLFEDALDAAQATEDAYDDKELFEAFDIHLNDLKEQLRYRCLDCQHINATGAMHCSNCLMVIGYTKQMDPQPGDVEDSQEMQDFEGGFMDDDYSSDIAD